MKDDDDDKEWKSSHDRFVDALERFLCEAEKQQRVQQGLLLEVSRAELLEHLTKRALHYSDAAAAEAEKPLEIPTFDELLAGIRMGKVRPRAPISPNEPTPEELKEFAEHERERQINMLKEKAAAFTFISNHLPAGKSSFILGYEECVYYEFIKRGSMQVGPPTL